MDRRSPERRHFVRGPVRPGRVMSIRYRSTNTSSWIIAETRNIGVGGAFISATTLLPVGTLIVLELNLPAKGQTFVLPAAVRWVSAQEGMGVQFVGVDIDVLLELNDYFMSLDPVGIGA